MVGIGNRFDGLHHFDGIGTNGIMWIVNSRGNGDFTTITH